MITGKLHQEGKNGGGRELYLRQSTESCIKDVFPKEICIITKKIEEKNKQARRGSNIELFTANNHFSSFSVCKRRSI